MIKIAPYEPAARCKVATPGSLADAIVTRFGDASDARWLEPSLGSGVFIRSLKSIGVTPERIRAIDLDSAPQAEDRSAQTLRGIDFLAWAQTTSERFDRIVGNPPYVPIRALGRRGQRTALSPLWNLHGVHVSKQANLWLAFVLACVRLLRPGGGMAIVLPASWEFSDYAATARTVLPLKFRDFTIFRSKRPLFTDVEEGSVVLFATGFGQQPKNRTRVESDDLESLVQQLLRTSLETDHAQSCVEYKGGGTQLGTLVEVRIGAVTGDAAYFVFNEENRRQHDLPARACTRVLSKARHLNAWAVNQNGWKRLRDQGEKVWLFRPSDQLARHLTVKKYLALAQNAGGCDRSAYKLQAREPWHRTPLPQVADCFISPSAGCGPWLALNDYRYLTATNTLYVGWFVKARTIRERCAVGLGLLTTAARQQLKLRQRVYAGGLRKLEPSDLSQISIPTINVSADIVSQYRTAVEALTHGDEATACSIADTLIA